MKQVQWKGTANKIKVKEIPVKHLCKSGSMMYFDFVSEIQDAVMRSTLLRTTFVALWFAASEKSSSLSN